ncbi:class I SAM-dependent methyltransferase [Burkholderia glumae]|uniref:class I SAM-dependent methyltransferase n=1 Tax=Burkholderia glumae TaxID=337 RepID=UPI000C26F472|nr:methyltransferase domain-containing protein [Burkholderia glumae]PJO20482.1 SAM-dependent methyltransferase [Burkholderia glumae AU6208]QHE11555.1 methyltransferase domain-containing protein [Burkholderia glumae AU6208]UVS97588.1 methyltransferase domain-containing protein [Burkholderia glumae]
MDSRHLTESTQKALWNGSAGHAWVAAQEVLDQMFKPFEDLLVNMLGNRGGLRVLDVGCGTGSTTLAVARQVGVDGNCIGVDISAPMIAVAQARGERESSPASFICADAQTHNFEPASFDLITSRFGVMFFDDPVSAFINLRRAAKDGAQLRCIAWRSAVDNPFMTTAERAAASLLPNLPVRRPDAPGQFAFADQSRVSAILETSGWTEIDIRPIDMNCTLPEQELVGYFSRLGPVGTSLQQIDEEMRVRVIESIRTAYDPYVHGNQVHYNAACWLISGRAGSTPA